MENNQFPRGVWPVVLTPFKEDGGIDFNGYAGMLDWYLERRVSGLFAVCLSSELFQLTAEERVALADFTVKHVNGKVPVVGCGGFGSTFAEKCDSIKAMAAAGLDAVVIPVGFAVEAGQDEDVLIANMERFLEALPDTKLGIYECPLPHRRLITPEALGRIARLDEVRIPFLKDTCCDADAIDRKLKAVNGTSLKLYNANLTTCLASLQSGAAGYSGTSANFYPEILADLVETFDKDPVRAEKIQQFLNLIQRHVEFKYPHSAKAFMALDHVPIGNSCRVECETLNGEQFVHLKALHRAIREFKEEMNII